MSSDYSNKRTSTGSSANSATKRRRLEPYTFPKRLLSHSRHHPCEKPYERNESKPLLSFNYWQSNTHILSSEISKLIDYLQKKGPLPEFFVSSPSYAPSIFKRIVLVAAHACCPVDLGNEILNSSTEQRFHDETRKKENEKIKASGSMAFLSSCSSVPIRHSHSAVTAGTWKYNEVETLTSQILWRSQSQSELGEVFRDHSVISAFRNYRICSSCLNEEVLSDEIIFVAYAKLIETNLVELFEDSDTKRKVVDLINTVFDSENQITKFSKTRAAMADIADHSDSTTVFGRFKQPPMEGAAFFSNSDIPQGQFVLKTVQEFTVLFLFMNSKLDQILMLVSGSSGESQGKVTFANAKFQLNVSKAILVSRDNEERVDLFSQQEEEKPKDEARDASLETSKAMIKKIYEESLVCNKNARSDFFESLEFHSLSREMRFCLGFPVVSEDGASIVNISRFETYRYTAVNSSAWLGRISSGSIGSIEGEKEKEAQDDEMEEGEEGECSDGDDEEGETDGAVDNDEGLDKYKGLLTSYLKESVEVLKIVAIDCEMCTTTSGLEITRVSLVSPEVPSLVVLDVLVLPESPITDYHTEFSGITEERMKGVTTKLSDVLTALRYVIGPETYVVGHSLDSDFKALGLIHDRVIDTTMLYPHFRGVPYKNSLKTLSLELLGMTMQDDEEAGHDSVQDAAVALELVLLYFYHELSNGSRVQQPPQASSSSSSSSSSLSSSSKTVAVDGNGSSDLLIRPKGVRAHDKVWTREDAFSIPKVPAIDKEWSGRVTGRGYPPHSSRSLQERFLIGYRGEADVGRALNHLDGDAKSSFLSSQGEGNPTSFQEVCGGAAESGVGNDLSELTWIDYTCTSSSSLVHHSSVQSKEESTEKIAVAGFLGDLDVFCNDVYSKIPRDTLLLVVTQGDLLPLAMKIAKKRRFQWAEKESSSSNNNSTTFMSGHGLEWNDGDEAELISSAAHALSGALFLKFKE